MFKLSPLGLEELISALIKFIMEGLAKRILNLKQKKMLYWKHKKLFSPGNNYTKQENLNSQKMK